MVNKPSFLKKRFLITQPMIRGLNGSTMVALELAEYLSSHGAQVVVYTSIALDPALRLFKEAGAHVVSAQEEWPFSIKDFDYIWVHSLTLPRPILDELKHPLKKFPAFVFLHMSTMEEIPDEHPWIYLLEKRLSSLSLYISEGTLQSNIKYGLPDNLAFFRNPAPNAFEKNRGDKHRSRTLKKLLIVSNHPPKELLDAKPLLEEKGVLVEIYGEDQPKYSPITPDILRKYDAVVTIGKTVQYCLLGDVPVYIYDRFGGPGWLNSQNYSTSKSMHFCGKLFEKKTSKEIAGELFDHIGDAIDFQADLSAEERSEFMLDETLRNLLSNLTPKKIPPLDSEYLESVKAAERCSEIRFFLSEEFVNTRIYCGDLAAQRDAYKKQCDAYKSQLDAVVNSGSFKLFSKILKPYKKIRSLFHK